MTIIGLNNVAAFMNMTQRGIRCVTRLDFTNNESPGETRIGQLRDYFTSTVVPLWQAVTSEKVTLDYIDFHIFGPAPDVWFREAYNLDGSVIGDVLPPYVSQRLYKIPNNVAIEGTNLEPFKVGRVALPGVPEIAQENGILNSAHVVSLNALAAALNNFNLSGGGASLYMFMYRLDPLNPAGTAVSAAPLTSLEASAMLGTQNSRKR